jgi:hypothetical protein
MPPEITGIAKAFHEWGIYAVASLFAFVIAFLYKSKEKLRDDTHDESIELIKNFVSNLERNNMLLQDNREALKKNIHSVEWCKRITERVNNARKNP